MSTYTLIAILCFGAGFALAWSIEIAKRAEYKRGTIDGYNTAQREQQIADAARHEQTLFGLPVHYSTPASVVHSPAYEEEWRIDA